MTKEQEALFGFWYPQRGVIDFGPYSRNMLQVLKSMEKEYAVNYKKILEVLFNLNNPKGNWSEVESLIESNEERLIYIEVY